jgi:hypothetical protein
MWAIIISLTSPVVAITISAWTLRRARNAESVRAFLAAQESYLSDRARRGRRIAHSSIANQLPEDDGNLLSQAERDDLGYALAVANTIAVACANNYMPESLVQESIGRSLRNFVIAARPYIDQMERKRGFRPYAAAERLAGRLQNLP